MPQKALMTHCPHSSTPARRFVRTRRDSSIRSRFSSMRLRWCSAEAGTFGGRSRGGVGRKSGGTEKIGVAKWTNGRPPVSSSVGASPKRRDEFTESWSGLVVASRPDALS